MKRILPLLLSTSVLFACQDEQSTPLPDAPSVVFAISDGAHDGNPEFFFFPPLVGSPSGTEYFGDNAFNPDLAPFVRICELNVGEPVTGPEPEPECVADVGPDLPMTVDFTNELYKVNWKTSDFPLDTNTHYRVQVMVGSSTVVGFRDVDPDPGPPVASCTDEPYCQFNYGNTIPIKVRIEALAFCPPGVTCQTKSFSLDGGVSFDLETTFGTTLLDIPDQTTLTSSGTVTFQECDVYVDDDPSIQFDLPTFGTCLETDILTDDFNPVLEVTATISLCDLDFHALGLTAAQAGDLRVHHFRGDGGIEALHPADNCGEFASLPSNASQGLASRIRDKVLSLFTPSTLMASGAVGHRSGGGGGLTTFGSKFMLALPGKIDFVNAADATRVAPAGSVLPTAAKVTDLHGRAVAGATVRWNVATAEVEGSVGPKEGDDSCEYDPGADDVVCTTGTSGVVEVEWTLADTPGTNKLTAAGRGIADSRDALVCQDASTPPSARNCNGPRNSDYTLGPFDPFTPILYDENDDDLIEEPADETFEEIAEGTRLLFTAIGCEPGFGTPIAIDGTMAPGEWDCALQETFPVNLSGGSTVDATLYYMNDGTDFHLAVVVPGTGRVNGLRIEWDSNGNGSANGREAGDDVWEFEPEGGEADKFVDEKCSTSSQSSCGHDDAAFGGSMDTEAAFNNTVGGQTVYEMSHPLSAGDTCTLDGRKGCGALLGEGIDLAASDGDSRGFFITLHLGSGAQGNTQWPGFLEYHQITIK